MSMPISSLTSTSNSQTSTSRPAEPAKKAVTAPETAIGVPYSTRVGSTTYSADVQQYNSEYQGSVSELFGVNATGSSVKQVEDHLGNLISFFA